MDQTEILMVISLKIQKRYAYLKKVKSSKATKYFGFTQIIDKTILCQSDL